MANDTSKRDEWLTGLIDSRLTDAEAQSLESLLAEDEQLHATLHKLQSNRRAIQAIAERNVLEAKPLPFDFADRVLAQIARIDAGAAESEEEKVEISSRSPSVERRQRSSWRVAAALLTLAAGLGAIALVANRLIPKNDLAIEQIAGSDSQRQSTEDSVDEAFGDQLIRENPFGALPPSGTPIPEVLAEGRSAVGTAEGRRYVSDPGFNVSLTLVLDIELTQAAFASGVLDSYIQQAGIQLASPLQSSAEIEDALARSRMLPSRDPRHGKSTGDNSTGGSSSAARMYFVHADLSKLGKLLETVYRDIDSVPKVRFDVAFDTGISGFMESIAASSGDRFALNESAAAAISFDAAESNQESSKLNGIPAMGVPVASHQRGRGQPELINGMPLSGHSCALLLVRIASDE